MKRIPIEAAKQISKKYDQKQVILVTFGNDGVTHVVTYGRTLKDCEQAAIGGNFVKKALGFQAEQCVDAPSRILRKRRGQGGK